MSDQMIQLLEQSETRERLAATERYWLDVGALADGDQQLDERALGRLRDDMAALGLSASQLRRDVHELRAVRTVAADDTDLAAVARERHVAAKERARAAAAALAEAKASLAAAEAEEEAARWVMSSTLDAIDHATRTRRAAVSRAEKQALALMGRGMPAALRPQFERSDEQPRPTVPHRLKKRALVDHVMREPGDVVLLHERTESDVVRPLGENESTASLPPRWRVKVLRNFRDIDRGLRLAGDVYVTLHDPTSNPFLSIVDDDVPLGLGDGEPSDEATTPEEVTE